jgi:hypothetical protein
MKSRLPILLLFVLLLSASAFAQLVVSYHLPGYTGDPIPLETTVSFAFNEELDLTPRWNIPSAPLAVLVNDPEDSIQFGDVTYEDDNHTVTVAVQLQPNTDYCFVITNARALNGDSLSIPYACSFSTRTQTEATSIMGTVVYEGHSVTGAIVGLLAQGPDYEHHRDTRYATVVTDEDGIFLLAGARPGTYWLAANIDLNHNGMRDADEPVAQYDEGDDGDIDSLVVSGPAMFGYTLTFGASAAPEPAAALPQSVTLAQNYPNPFNPTTTISFTLPDTRAARLAVFDVLGREIAVLHNGLLTAGEHAVHFDAQDLPAGLYFYRLDAGDASLTHKMLLIK